MATSMLGIRNEFYAQSSPNPTNYGTGSHLYQLGFYRGQYYFNVSTNSYVQFPSGQITIGNFIGVKANCYTASNCVCLCACDCGDGSSDGGDGE